MKTAINKFLIPSLVLWTQCGPVAAVGDDDSSELASASQALSGTGGPIINIETDGSDINGPKLGGKKYVERILLSNVKVPGAPSDISLTIGGRGKLLPSPSVTSLKNAELTSVLFDLATRTRVVGSTRVRIDTEIPAGSCSGGGAYACYTASYHDGTSWSNYCPDGSKVFAVGGYWRAEDKVKIDDPNSFIFACENSAIAKCMTPYGYPPKGYDGAQDRLHQACVRMIRADYCGNGQPTTVSGQWVGLWDNAGLYALRPDPRYSWDFEGQWDENGAVCVQITRMTYMPGSTEKVVHWMKGIPSCAGKLTAACNSGAFTGADRGLIKSAVHRFYTGDETCKGALCRTTHGPVAIKEE